MSSCWKSDEPILKLFMVEKLMKWLPLSVCLQYNVGLGHVQNQIVSTYLVINIIHDSSYNMTWYMTYQILVLFTVFILLNYFIIITLDDSNISVRSDNLAVIKHSLIGVHWVWILDVLLARTMAMLSQLMSSCIPWEKSNFILWWKLSGVRPANVVQPKHVKFVILHFFSDLTQFWGVKKCLSNPASSMGHARCRQDSSHWGTIFLRETFTGVHHRDDCCPGHLKYVEDDEVALL